MYPNYNYYPPQQAQTQATYRAYTQPVAPILKGRPVSSFEEVRASTIDFDGSVFYFPDLANKKIYTKQINMDGTASFNIYELKEIPINIENNSSNFITREEFENAINQLMNLIPQKETQQNLQF